MIGKEKENGMNRFPDKVETESSWQLERAWRAARGRVNCPTYRYTLIPNCGVQEGLKDGNTKLPGTEIKLPNGQIGRQQDYYTLGSNWQMTEFLTSLFLKEHFSCFSASLSSSHQPLVASKVTKTDKTNIKCQDSFQSLDDFKIIILSLSFQHDQQILYNI